MSRNFNRALVGALIQRDTNGALAALQDGADPDAEIDGTRPLIVATIAGSLGMIDLLLSNGGSAGVRDNLGRTALHWAAIGVPDSDPELVEALIRAGADPNAPDLFGCSPLDLAAGAENRATAAALISAGGTCKADRRAWVQAVSGGASGRTSSERGRSR